MKKIRRMILYIVLSLITLLIIAAFLFFSFAPQFGAGNKGIEQKERSKQFVDGKFQNLVETNMKMSFSESLSVMKAFMKNGENRLPQDTLETLPIDTSMIHNLPNETLSVTWLGHSTLIITIGGKTILTDPVFSKRASIFQSVGPKNFAYSTSYSVEQLPKIDAVVISHDHYDHLDYATILQLKKKVKSFFVPLGVSQHLVRWGIDQSQITELDWWENAVLDSNIVFTCTPSRHFSGRGITDRDKTLWASWVIQSKSKRVFFGGDSGYFYGFKEIGEKYGPFDLTILECGQYNERWANIHMMPEETVQAHIDLKGKSLLPVHWGKFKLSLHSWTEPIERASARAKTDSVSIITPKIGAVVLLDDDIETEAWWKQ